MKKKLLIGGIIIFLIGGVIGVLYDQRTDNVLGLATSEFQKYASDVIGTKTGTTTAGVAFSINALSSGQSATTTYVSFIGDRDKAIYTVKVLKASSTSNFLLDIQGSNDDYCDKAVATSTSDVLYTDIPLLGDINWFSAGDHLKGKVHSTSFSNASSTLSFLWLNPDVGVGNEIILSDLNYRCLKLSVSGSSTVMWVQLRTR